MGMTAEFNWYIVIKENNVTTKDDLADLKKSQLSMYHKYRFIKDGYRIYPLDTPLPILYNGKCVGVGSIGYLKWLNNETWIEVEPLISFQKDDVAASTYEESFRQYKIQQEAINDGGKVDLRKMVNHMERIRIK